MAWVLYYNGKFCFLNHSSQKTSRKIQGKRVPFRNILQKTPKNIKPFMFYKIFDITLWNHRTPITTLRVGPVNNKKIKN